MSETIRHELPLLSSGQAQKEVTHNEALLQVDRLLHLFALSRSLPAPPAAPAPGDAYIVAADPTGAWAERSGTLAHFDGFGWVFTAPVRGCLAWIADESCFSVHDLTWSTSGLPVDALQISGRRVLGEPPISIAVLTAGATIDVEVRAAITELLAALRGQGIIL